MRASDVMSRDVVSVGPDTPLRDIAKLLLEKGISAVPVVDGAGAPLGMVSEGDLVGRSDAEREARRDWWLTLLAEGEALSDEFLAGLRSHKRSAREIMSAPIVTIGETEEVGEIARLLATYRIKRVPVVRDGRVVGIVSRADLLRTLVAGESRVSGASAAADESGLVAALDQHAVHRRAAAADRRPEPAADHGVSVEDFRGLVADSRHETVRLREAERKAVAALRGKWVKELIDRHIVDDSWQGILHSAREAAEHGAKEFMLLRFPHELCSDGGRAINAPEPGWPGTLNGEAAEVYLRWERDLRPHGFHLAARMIDFPGGFPGDIGLFLIWGE
jgi:CBS domain-containing protein